MYKAKTVLMLSLQGKERDIEKAQIFINSVKNLDTKPIPVTSKSTPKFSQRIHFLIISDLSTIDYIIYAAKLIGPIIAIVKVIKYLLKHRRKFRIEFKTESGAEVSISKNTPWTLNEIKKLFIQENRKRAKNYKKRSRSKKKRV